MLFFIVATHNNRKNKMSVRQYLALKISAVLWLLWGVISSLLGIVIIASYYDPVIDVVNGLINANAIIENYKNAFNEYSKLQGWQLTWVGAVAMIGASFIWCRSIKAIWVTALVGGPTSFGHIVFAGPDGAHDFEYALVMSLLSFTAILLSFCVWLSLEGDMEEPDTKFVA